MAFLTPISKAAQTLLLALALCWPGERAAAQNGAVGREYAVKAVFLLNFCQFTTWPQTSFASPKSPIVIGVLGADPFGNLLEEAVAGESADGRSIRLARLRSVEEARHCHVVFVPRAAMGSANALIQSVRGRSVLTVGEAEEFLAAGGMISLAAESGKIRLKMNLPAVRSAALIVSSKLLRLATR